MGHLHYHIGKLTNHFESSFEPRLLNFHLNLIFRKFEDGELIIHKSNHLIFKKIMSRLMKYQGTWDKENWEFKILYYSLVGLLKSEGCYE
jgi:hypothetical protein